MQMNNIKMDDEENLPSEDDIKPDIIFDIDDVESENNMQNNFFAYDYSVKSLEIISNTNQDNVPQINDDDVVIPKGSVF